jgi:hypothetical protein
MQGGVATISQEVTVLSPSISGFQKTQMSGQAYIYAMLHAMYISIYLGTTLKSVSAKIGAITLPGPGKPSQLPASPLSSQLEQAHLAVVMRKVQAHTLPAQPCTLRPVSRLNDTSSPQPTPERIKKPLRGPTAGTGDMDSSPRE